MNYKINNHVCLNVWESGWPVWSHLRVDDCEVSLNNYELKCLIAAAEEIIKYRTDKENHDQQLRTSYEMGQNLKGGVDV